MIENEYTVFVTYKCNWNCNYCIVNTHKQPWIDFDTVIDKVRQIPDGASIKLMGGEPGVLTALEMKRLFDLMRSKNLTIYMITNGTFMERHSKYVEDCEEILYHCSEDMDKPLVRYDYDNIVYQLVVSDKNIFNFEKFINDNSDIEFVVYASQRNPAGGPVLSRKNALHIAIKYRDRLNKDSIIKLMDNCSDESQFI